MGKENCWMVKGRTVVVQSNNYRADLLFASFFRDARWVVSDGETCVAWKPMKIFLFNSVYDFISIAGRDVRTHSYCTSHAAAEKDPDNDE